MTIERQMAVLFPPIEMPSDVRARVLGLVHSKLRRQRMVRRARRVVVVAIAAVLVSLVSGSVNAQVILPNPPHCTECYMTWLAVVHTSNVEGRGVQR